MVFKRTIEEQQLEQTSDTTMARKNMDTTCKLFYAIYQVLLLRQGPIQEFNLTIRRHGTCFEIGQIILHLSRNHTVLRLTLDLNNLLLPLSLFSMQQLTDLSLKSCAINRIPVFNGFGSLTSISLEFVYISIECLKHLLRVCPSLKSLKLITTDDHIWGDKTFRIMDFFKCLPVVEHLTTTRYFSEYGVNVSVPEETSTSLIHLKYFCSKEMRVVERSGWTFLFVLIQCSPNLERIKLEMNTEIDTDVDDCDEEFVMFEEYSNVWLEHLIELEVKDFKNCKTMMEFLKFILARSPNLKKVILLTWMNNKHEELEMLTILLSSPRASPVKIIVKNRCRAQP
ncbi:hypothetical protein M8C21_005300 [Ambrosia artemisiifolia]|uniref:FBD domain-containing protein n=1 Tax=Ambrosia artemisiifolia TaxID=4212 RepID=A0AAD5G5Y1_AMBAR|nr:hypothetical protein M8C21_005300 [Ambrosia artemisiifolia]